MEDARHASRALRVIKHSLFKFKCAIAMQVLPLSLEATPRSQKALRNMHKQYHTHEHSSARQTLHIDRNICTHTLRPASVGYASSLAPVMHNYRKAAKSNLRYNLTNYNPHKRRTYHVAVASNNTLRTHLWRTHDAVPSGYNFRHYNTTHMHAQGLSCGCSIQCNSAKHQ